MEYLGRCDTSAGGNLDRTQEHHDANARSHSTSLQANHGSEVISQGGTTIKSTLGCIDKQGFKRILLACYRHRLLSGQGNLVKHRQEAVSNELRGRAEKHQIIESASKARLKLIERVSREHRTTHPAFRPARGAARMGGSIPGRVNSSSANATSIRRTFGGTLKCSELDETIPGAVSGLGERRIIRAEGPYSPGGGRRPMMCPWARVTAGLAKPVPGRRLATTTKTRYRPAPSALPRPWRAGRLPRSSMPAPGAAAGGPSMPVFWRIPTGTPTAAVVPWKR